MQNLGGGDCVETEMEPVGALYIMDDEAVGDYEIQCVDATDEQLKEDLEINGDSDSLSMWNDMFNKNFGRAQVRPAVCDFEFCMKWVGKL